MTVLYSLIVPIYNDAELADDFCISFEETFQRFLCKDVIAEDVELIFVDDGSRDSRALKEAFARFAFVRVIHLSRNFGQHIALSCGYRESRGRYVGMLNVDMQDPPHEIPKLIALLQEGNFDIVYGSIEQRRSSWHVRLTSWLFYKTLNWLTGFDIPTNLSSLRMMNRAFVDVYNALSEKSRFLPGLEIWLGFRHGVIPITHQARARGKSSYSTISRLKMALDSIISFSDVPLKLTVIAGSCVALIGFVLTLLLVVTKLFFVELSPGYTSTIAIIIFLGGAQMLVIGLASLYIGRILREVQGRPLYVIRAALERGRVKSD